MESLVTNGRSSDCASASRRSTQNRAYCNSTISATPLKVVVKSIKNIHFISVVLRDTTVVVVVVDTNFRQLHPDPDIGTVLTF